MWACGLGEAPNHDMINGYEAYPGQENRKLSVTGETLCVPAQGMVIPATAGCPTLG